jgi:hypothetical protein
MALASLHLLQPAGAASPPPPPHFARSADAWQVLMAPLKMVEIATSQHNLLPSSVYKLNKHPSQASGALSMNSMWEGCHETLIRAHDVQHPSIDVLSGSTAVDAGQEADKGQEDPHA